MKGSAISISARGVCRIKISGERFHHQYLWSRILSPTYPETRSYPQRVLWARRILIPGVPHLMRVACLSAMVPTIRDTLPVRPEAIPGVRTPLHHLLRVFHIRRPQLRCWTTTVFGGRDRRPVCTANSQRDSMGTARNGNEGPPGDA